MTFPRIATRYIRASFVDTKTAPSSLPILWSLSDLSGTNLNEGPSKRLFPLAEEGKGYGLDTDFERIE